MELAVSIGLPAKGGLSCRRDGAKLAPGPGPPARGLCVLGWRRSAAPPGESSLGDSPPCRGGVMHIRRPKLCSCDCHRFASEFHTFFVVSWEHRKCFLGTRFPEFIARFQGDCAARTDERRGFSAWLWPPPRQHACAPLPPAHKPALRWLCSPERRASPAKHCLLPRMQPCRHAPQQMSSSCRA